MTKAKFIRQYPTKTPRQVSALATKAGLHITPSYVSNVRMYDSNAEHEAKPKNKKKRKSEVEAGSFPTLVKPSDIHLDSTHNQRSHVEVETTTYKARPSTADVRKVSGDGLVRAFKALVVAIGTRLAHQLVDQVDDETAKLFGRPPV